MIFLEISSANHENYIFLIYLIPTKIRLFIYLFLIRFTELMSNKLFHIFPPKDHFYLTRTHIHSHSQTFL